MKIKLNFIGFLMVLSILILIGCEKRIQSIDFPEELLWWLYEAKKANPNIEVNNFFFISKEITDSRIYDDWSDRGVLTNYGIGTFKEVWNSSGNLAGYLKNGDVFIADRDKNILFIDGATSSHGTNAISWLTDTVLVSVGINIDDGINLFISYNKVDRLNNTVERTTYYYENAFDNNERMFLKLNWYEHCADNMLLEP